MATHAEHVGHNVKLARIRAKLLQKELAAQTGITVGRLGHLERGTGVAQVSELRVIAAALRVPIGQLLEVEEEEQMAEDTTNDGSASATGGPTVDEADGGYQTPTAPGPSASAVDALDMVSKKDRADIVRQAAESGRIHNVTEELIVETLGKLLKWHARESENREVTVEDLKDEFARVMQEAGASEVGEPIIWEDVLKSLKHLSSRFNVPLQST